MARPIPKRFYRRYTPTVACELLGCEVHVHGADGRLRRGRIVETEAYRGFDDRACHGWRGETPRLRSLFGPGGHAFVYVTYGLHHMLNVVTEDAGFPSGVLLRAIEPIDDDFRSGGPGLLSHALRVTQDHDGSDLRYGIVRIYPANLRPRERVASSTRVGVEYAGREAASLPWRFFIVEHPCLSRGRPTDPERAANFVARREATRRNRDAGGPSPLHR